MLHLYKKQSINFGFTFILLLSFVIGGCALGTKRVNITHAPLDRIENKKEGNILVKPFVDKRKDTQHIGNIRNNFGMDVGHIETEEGVKLDVLLTTYFTEALKEAGYNAVIQEAQSAIPQSQVKFDAIIDGEITDFWLDTYMAVWHYVGVKVKAIDSVNQSVIWTKDIKGDERNLLWYGATSEYEKVINQAVTIALNQATKEFASDEFYKSFKK